MYIVMCTHYILHTMQLMHEEIQALKKENDHATPKGARGLW